ncbi:MAG: delta-60 repeat domain-containing protein [Flavobacteriales bacterium]|nr:delta-60 repeat domain-containing protein [Flavobacteriales bacterium]
MGRSLGYGASARVRNVLVQPDGRILIAGDFTQYHNVQRQRIARLESDGTLDHGFSTLAGANATVWRMALQADGKVLVVGDFVNFGFPAQNRVARVNTDGSHDTSFDIGVGPQGPGVTVRDVKVQADGKILVAGEFTSFNGHPAEGVARSRSVRWEWWSWCSVLDPEITHSWLSATAGRCRTLQCRCEQGVRWCRSQLRTTIRWIATLQGCDNPSGTFPSTTHVICTARTCRVDVPPGRVGPVPHGQCDHQQPGGCLRLCVELRQL